MYTLLDESAGVRELTDMVNRILKRDAGVASFGTRILWTDFSGKGLNRQTGVIEDNDVPTLTIENGDGEHLLIRKSTDSSTVFEVQDEGVTFSVLNPAGGALTISGNLTVQGSFTTQSTVLMGNADSDTVDIIGVTTFRNNANTTIQARIDAGNNRVIFGSGSPLGSDSTPAVHVVGRLYVAPESANDLAFQIRRSSAASVGWSIGVESDNDLVFKDDAGTIRVTFGDASSAFGLLVTAGGLTVSAGGAGITGDTTISTRLAVGAASWSGGEELRVVGQSRHEGTLTVTTGGASLTGGTGTLGVPLVLTGNQQYTGIEMYETDLTTLTCYFGLDTSANYILANAIPSGYYWSFQSQSTERLRLDGTGVGFNAATPIARPDYTVTNPTTDRALNVTGDTLAQGLAVLGTLIADLISYGLLQ